MPAPSLATRPSPTALFAQRHVQALAALTGIAAAVRFSTLSVQSFWLDEAVTVELVRRPFGDMLSAIPGSESTPPLYYVLAWAWSHVFGTGEAGLRSLSALLGTATIPVAYAAAARLVSRRAGLVVAALAAVNPLLVWYSQEARAYALLVLLTAGGLALFARLLDEPSPRAFVGWALLSAAALATHYFALFLVVPQAAWLLLRRRSRMELAAVGAVAAVGAALLPLAIDQSDNRSADFIGKVSLAKRVAQVPKQYLVGFDSPLETALTVVAAVLAAYGIWLLARRSSQPERAGAARATVIAALALGVPLMMALAGADYLITRNLIAAWLPCAVVVAGGLGAARAGRSGTASAVALCGIALFAVIALAATPAYQRSDWRGLGRALGPAGAPRALVITPVNGARALAIYARGITRWPARGAPVTEVDALAVADRRLGQTPAAPHPAAPPPPPPGFAVAEFRRTRTYTLVRYRATRPLPLAFVQLALLALTPGAADFALQLPAH